MAKDKKKSVIKLLKEAVTAADISHVFYQLDEVQENNHYIKVRRIYIPRSTYSIGWIHDDDVSYCMKCAAEFTLIKRKHHCRSCGNIYCSDCTPYIAPLPLLEEEKSGSRVCLNCFGLRSSEIRSPEEYTKYFNEHSPQENERCRLAYREMRGIVPPNISCTTLAEVRRMLPVRVADRIWTCRALWLICMHMDDIRKTHVADLIGKYAPVGLDLIELRAIWYVLPKWDDETESEKRSWKRNLKRQLNDAIGSTLSLPSTSKVNMSRHAVYEEIKSPVFDPDHEIQKRYGIVDVELSTDETPVTISPLPSVGKELLKDIFCMKDVEGACTRVNFECSLEDEVMDAEIDGWLKSMDVTDDMQLNASSPYICTARTVPDSDDDTLPPTPVDLVKTPFSVLSARNHPRSSARRKRYTALSREVSACNLNHVYFQEDECDTKENIANNTSPTRNIEISPDDILKLLRNCDVARARLFMKQNSVCLNPSEATSLLYDLFCSESANAETVHKSFKDTVLFLIDNCSADINVLCTNKCPLQHVTDENLLCSLIFRGVDLTSACAVLSRIVKMTSTQLQALVEDFEQVTATSVLTMNQYTNFVIILLVTGAAEKASLTASAYEVNLNSEVASKLMRISKFDEMLEPVETFELLERYSANSRNDAVSALCN